jgi:hypothetical protein
LNDTPIASDTREIRVEIRAEDGFDPQADVDGSSLTFGAVSAVNFGEGCKPQKTENVGKNLVVTFAGEGHRLKEDDFAAKLLGRTKKGDLLFGYARLPGQNHIEPILRARNPTLNRREPAAREASVVVENFGQARSAPAQLQLIFQRDKKTVHTATAGIPALDPYAGATVTVALPADVLPAESTHDVDVIINPDAKRPEVLRVTGLQVP